MLKIVTVLGARPQFIKAAVVSKIFSQSQQINEVIIHTGQHFDDNMSEIFFEQMQIPKPNYYLNINSGNHGEMTGRMLIEIEKVLLKEKPEWVLVYGDTNSTLAGALAASKLHIKVAHVEAGLRSFNMNMPEEINRILTDRVSTKLFCPTQIAKENLIKEGYENFKYDISVTGDVMYDAVLHFSKMTTSNEKIKNIIEFKEPFILATIHRAENTDFKDRLEGIFKALDTINTKVRVILPLHPRTKKYLDKYGIQTEIALIDPIGYIEMLKLLEHCALVVTDSGGLQKEAYFFNKYCITVRDETEWVELVDNGYNYLVGARSDAILSAFDKIIQLGHINSHQNLYGNGEVARKILDIILD